MIIVFGCPLRDTSRHRTCTLARHVLLQDISEMAGTNQQVVKAVEDTKAEWLTTGKMR